MADDRILRQQLLELIDGHGAHMPFEAAVRDLTVDAVNRRAPNMGYTGWHILEHVRIAQRDILDYIRQLAYLPRDWPEEYWPEPEAMATAEQLAETLAGYRADRQALHDLVADPATDPLATIPGTPGHSILREVRLSADHGAYHIGEFAVLRQVLGTWPAGRGERD